MHRPYHRLAAIKNSPYAPQRQHALIYPMQMNDVSLLKFRSLCDVDACIGYRHRKEVLAAEEIVQPYHKPFVDEAPRFSEPAANSRHIEVVGIFLNHQHLGLNTIVDKGFGEPACCNGRPTRSLACIDNKDSHYIYYSSFVCAQL